MPKARSAVTGPVSIVVVEGVILKTAIDEDLKEELRSIQNCSAVIRQRDGKLIRT